MWKKKPYYYHILFKREFNALLGSGSRSFIRLVVLLTAMIAAIGFALGGISILRDRMDDPFTYTLDVPIPIGSQDLATSIRDTFLTRESRDSFFIVDGEFSQVTFEWMYNYQDSTSNWYRTRSLSMDSKLADRILSDPDILIRRIHPFSIQDPGSQCGVIATEDAIRAIGLSTATASYLPFTLGDADPYIIYFPLLAIVKRLPDKCDIAVPDPLALLLRSDHDASGFLSIHERNQDIILLVEEKIDSQTLDKVFSSLVTKNKVYHFDLEELSFDRDTRFKKIRITLQLPQSFEEKLQWVDALRKMLPQNRILFTVPTYCRDLTQMDQYQLRRHRISFQFSDLSRVREFERKLNISFGLSVDMARIESSRNFSLVTALTWGLGLGMFFFCLLGMVFSMDQLVENHLQRSRTGLGTLAAFGLSGKTMARVFIRAILSFVLLASFCAFLVTCLFKLLLYFFGLSPYLILFDYRIFIALFISWVIVYISIKRGIAGHLRKTPGDLVYNR